MPQFGALGVVPAPVYGGHEQQVEPGIERRQAPLHAAQYARAGVDALYARRDVGVEARGYWYLEDLLPGVAIETSEQAVLAPYRDHGSGPALRCDAIDRSCCSHIPVM